MGSLSYNGQSANQGREDRRDARERDQQADDKDVERMKGTRSVYLVHLHTGAAPFITNAAATTEASASATSSDEQTTANQIGRSPSP